MFFINSSKEPEFIDEPDERRPQKQQVDVTREGAKEGSGGGGTMQRSILTQCSTGLGCACTAAAAA
jgi:hypothetical protein